MTVVGTAEVTVTPGTAGFGPKTEAAVKAALAGIKADIELTLDQNGLREKITAAVAAASAGENVDIGVDLDVRSLEEKIAAANAVAGAIDLNVDIDGTGVEGELRRLIATLEATNKVDLRTSLSGGGAQADTIGAAVGGTFGRAVLRTAARVLAAAGLAQLFTAATAGAVALSGALISASSAAGSLVGIVGALPGLLSAAAQAAGVVALALGGVGGAIKAFSAAQKAVGAAADRVGGGQSASAAHAAERAIRNATQGIEDAQRSAADAVENANERIVKSVRDVQKAEVDLSEAFESSARRIDNAERDLSRSHRAAQDATEALTRAREEARQEVEDLRRSVARLALTEDEARARLTEARTKQSLEARRAQQDLTGVSEATLKALERQAAAEDKAATNPRDKAALALRDAELDLSEATTKRIDTEGKLAAVEKTGVEGTQKVITAKEKLADANQSVIDNERDLVLAQREGAKSIVDAQERVTLAMEEQAKAQRDLVRAQEDGARRIADAQEALADAFASAADSAAAGADRAAGAVSRYQAALDALSPAARHFVEFLVGLQPKLREVQAIAAAGLFPGLEQAIRTLLPLVSQLEPVIAGTASAIAGLAVGAANLVSSPAFSRDIVLQGTRNIDIIKTLGRAALSTTDFLRNVAIAGGPLAQHIADITANLAGLAAQAAQTGRDNGKLEAFFNRVGDRLDKLLVTVGLLGHGLLTVFSAATPSGDRYLTTLEKLAAKFDIIAERAKKSGALQAFFESTRGPVEAVARLVSDLASALVRIGTNNFGTFSIFIDELRTKLLPVLEKILGSIDTAFLSSLVSLAAGFGKLFGALLGGNPALTVLVNVLAGMATGIARLLTDIPLLSPLLLTLVTTLSALGTVAAVIKIEQLAARFAGSVAGVELLSGAFARFGGVTAVSAAQAQAAALKVEAAAAQEAAAVQAGFVAVEGKAGLAAAAVAGLGKALLIGAIVYGVKQAVDALAPSMDKLTRSVIAAKDPAKELETQLARFNKPGLLDTGLLLLKNPVDLLKISLSELSLDFKQVGRDVDEFNRKTRVDTPAGFRAVAEASVTQGQKVIDSWGAQGKSTLAYQRILADVIAEKGRQGVADDEAKKRIDLVTDSLKVNNDTLQVHADKLRAATDRALSLSNADLDVRDAFDRLTKAVEDSSGSFKVNEEKGRAAQRAYNDVVSSLQRQITEFGKSTEAGKFDNAEKQKLIDHLNKLAKQNLPETAEQVANMRLQLEAIKPTYFATVIIDTEQAKEAMRQLTHEFNLSEEAARAAIAIFGAANAAKLTAQIESDTGNILPKGRASGGRVLRNRAYIVGERRPELFVPDKDGVILPTVPDVSVPEEFRTAFPDMSAMTGTHFDMSGLVTSLQDLEKSLTEQLAARDGTLRRDVQPAQDVSAARTEVHQEFHEALVKIEATFGPGSSAADIIKAMEQIADQRLAAALAQVLKDHGAGVGTRGTP